MKTFYGVLAGVFFSGMVIAASDGMAWAALFFAGMASMMLTISIKVQ